MFQDEQFASFPSGAIQLQVKPGVPVAQALPSATAIAGHNGLAHAKPGASATVGHGGIALAFPAAHAISGVQGISVSHPKSHSTAGNGGVAAAGGDSIATVLSPENFVATSEVEDGSDNQDPQAVIYIFLIV